MNDLVFYYNLYSILSCIVLILGICDIIVIGFTLIIWGDTDKNSLATIKYIPLFLFFTILLLLLFVAGFAYSYSKYNELKYQGIQTGIITCDKNNCSVINTKLK